MKNSGIILTQSTEIITTQLKEPPILSFNIIIEKHNSDFRLNIIRTIAGILGKENIPDNLPTEFNNLSALIKNFSHVYNEYLKSLPSQWVKQGNKIIENFTGIDLLDISTKDNKLALEKSVNNVLELKQEVEKKTDDILNQLVESIAKKFKNNNLLINVFIGTEIKEEHEKILQNLVLNFYNLLENTLIIGSNFSDIVQNYLISTLNEHDLWGEEKEIVEIIPDQNTASIMANKKLEKFPKHNNKNNLSQKKVDNQILKSESKKPVLPDINADELINLMEIDTYVAIGISNKIFDKAVELFQNGEIGKAVVIFDYLIKKETCPTFNAYRLLNYIGIISYFIKIGENSSAKYTLEKLKNDKKIQELPEKFYSNEKIERMAIKEFRTDVSSVFED